MTLLEDFFNFFERSSNCFWIHEENVDKGSKVEGSKNEVGFPRNTVKPRRDGVCKSKVEKPVGRLIYALCLIWNSLIKESLPLPKTLPSL